MIGQRVTKPTARDEREAYELATLRDRDTCQRCHRNCGPIARDHRKGRGVGGLTVVSNLQCLGLRCHIFKTENPAAALAEGWAVPSHKTPAEWPARRYVRTRNGTLTPVWVLYANDGTWAQITDAEAVERMAA